MKFTSGKYLKVTTERELNPSSFFSFIFQSIKNNKGSLHKFITQCCKRKNQQNEILASVFLPPTW